VDYKELRYYINLDELMEPQLDGYFLEIKSRTWSLKDAEQKARAISELLAYLQIDEMALLREEYVRIEK
jgi:5-methylthioadenosine/S-adenosylhomocysteine deaminase